MKIKALVVLSTLALLLGAACGGDEEPASDTRPAQETEEQEETNEDAGGDGSFSTSECIELQTAMAEAAVAAGGGGGTDADPAETVAQIRAMGDVAPDEIKDDFMVMADALEEFYTTIADAGIDFSDPASYSTPEAAEILAAAGEDLANSGMDEASTNIQMWLQEVCPAA